MDSSSSFNSSDRLARPLPARSMRAIEHVSAMLAMEYMLAIGADAAAEALERSLSQQLASDDVEASAQLDEQASELLQRLGEECESCGATREGIDERSTLVEMVTLLKRRSFPKRTQVPRHLPQDAGTLPVIRSALHSEAQPQPRLEDAGSHEARAPASYGHPGEERASVPRLPGVIQADTDQQREAEVPAQPARVLGSLAPLRVGPPPLPAGLPRGIGLQDVPVQTNGAEQPAPEHAVSLEPAATLDRRSGTVPSSGEASASDAAVKQTVTDDAGSVAVTEQVAFSEPVEPPPLPSRVVRSPRDEPPTGGAAAHALPSTSDEVKPAPLIASTERAAAEDPSLTPEGGLRAKRQHAKAAAALEMDYDVYTDVAVAATRPWTAAEVSLLREAVKLYPTKAFPEKAARLKTIAGHVGTRTKKECAAKMKELKARRKDRNAAKQDVTHATHAGQESASETDEDERSSSGVLVHQVAQPLHAPPSTASSLLSESAVAITATTDGVHRDTADRATVAAQRRRVMQEVVLDEEEEDTATTTGLRATTGHASTTTAAPEPMQWGSSQQRVAAHIEEHSEPATRGRGRFGRASEVVIAEPDEDDAEPMMRSSSKQHVAPPVVSAPIAQSTMYGGRNPPHTVMEAVEDIEDAPAVSADANRPAPSSAPIVATSTPVVDTAAVAAAAVLVKTLGLRNTPISLEDAVRVRLLLFGEGRGARSAKTGRLAVRAFSTEWLKQGLYFTDVPGLRYGLVQVKGGPCGALAAVQAELLRHLLYSDFVYFEGTCSSDALHDAGSGAWAPMEAEGLALDPSPQQQQRALVLALADIVWRARRKPDGPAIVALPGGPSSSTAGVRAASTTLTLDGLDIVYQPDGLTESLRLFDCPSLEATAAVIESNLETFTRQDGSGVVLAVYSAMLSRGLAECASDMDAGPAATAALVGAHNYASQELVNLLLTGRAHSNVFDGERDLSSGDDHLVLRGVPARCLTGFLTLFEHYGYVQVGEHFKTPQAPIWVVCSESHYSVLFAAPRGVIYPDAALAPVHRACVHGHTHTQPVPEHARGLAALAATVATPFDLLYYDGLARQDELIRLTVSRGAPSAAADAHTHTHTHTHTTMKMGMRRAGEQADEDPPLERVIRTKWQDASVSWNASEPIL